MATFNPKRLISPAFLSTSASSALYTVGSNTTTMVKQILIANTSANATTVNIYLVPSGGSAGPTNLVFPSVSISGNSTITFDLNQALNTGDAIYASAAAASAVTMMATGYEAV